MQFACSAHAFCFNRSNITASKTTCTVISIFFALGFSKWVSPITHNHQQPLTVHKKVLTYSSTLVQSLYQNFFLFALLLSCRICSFCRSLRHPQVLHSSPHGQMVIFVPYSSIILHLRGKLKDRFPYTKFKKTITK